MQGTSDSDHLYDRLSPAGPRGPSPYSTPPSGLQCPQKLRVPSLDDPLLVANVKRCIYRIDLELKARRRGHTQSEPSIEYLQQPALVGPDGQVTRLEIIPEVAKRAAETVASLGIANVQIIEGDGGNGSPDAASYDRAIFTAGPFDLPRHFHEQIREGGLLLVVVKTGGGGDNLFLLRKSGDHLESIESTHS